MRPVNAWESNIQRLVTETKLIERENKMYDNLLAEVKIIQDAWGYDFLGALEVILDLEDEYPSVVRKELKQFMRDGAKMFAPVEEVEYDVVSSDGTVIDSYTVRI